MVRQERGYSSLFYFAISFFIKFFWLNGSGDSRKKCSGQRTVRLLAHDIRLHTLRAKKSKYSIRPLEATCYRRTLLLFFCIGPPPCRERKGVRQRQSINHKGSINANSCFKQHNRRCRGIISSFISLLIYFLSLLLLFCRSVDRGPFLLSF